MPLKVSVRPQVTVYPDGRTPLTYPPLTISFPKLLFFRQIFDIEW